MFRRKACLLCLGVDTICHRASMIRGGSNSLCDEVNVLRDGAYLLCVAAGSPIALTATARRTSLTPSRAARGGRRRGYRNGGMRDKWLDERGRSYFDEQ